MPFKRKYDKAQYEKARRLWRRGGMSCPEIAREAGVPVAAIHVWVSRKWKQERSDSAMDAFLSRSA